MAKAKKGSAKKGKGKGDDSNKPKPRSPIRPMKWGVLTALLVAGYPLYDLVNTGNLSVEWALARFAVVAAASALGFVLVKSLLTAYQVEALARKRANRLRAIELAQQIQAEQRMKAAEAEVEATRSALASRKGKALNPTD